MFQEPWGPQGWNPFASQASVTVSGTDYDSPPIYVPDDEPEAGDSDATVDFSQRSQGGDDNENTFDTPGLTEGGNMFN